MREFLRSKKIFFISLVTPILDLLRLYFNYNKEPICDPILGVVWNCTFFEYFDINSFSFFISFMLVLFLVGLIYFISNKRNITAIIWSFFFLAFLVPITIIEYYFSH